jgi:hypothetical protein
VTALTALVDPLPGGDPLPEAKDVRRSWPALSEQLADGGHEACPTTVGTVLRELESHRYVNVKRFTGPAPPDRDPQFQYLTALVAAVRDAGLPLLSVDTKKKEVSGNCAPAGATWRQEADAVKVPDFWSDAHYRGVPYGRYEGLAKPGQVLVGTSADTPQCAAEAGARGWARIGGPRDRGVGDRLVLADSGGSNGCRPRMWNWGWPEWLADRYGLTVTGCHYPTGASKWTPVEHRLCGPISVNGAGVPLRTPALRLGFLRGTPPATGLRVSAEWWERTYTTGVKVTDAEMPELNLDHPPLCPRWTSTLRPRNSHPGH